MARPRVLEVKRRLDGAEERFACEAALVEPGRRAVLIYVLDRVWQVADLTLRRGTRTFAHFWTDRPYNVYHWLEGERTVGHYFNVGRCDEIAAEHVRWTDHVLDVLATPDGRVRVLDEDELQTAPTDIRRLASSTSARIVSTIASLTAEVEAETRRLL